MNLKRNIRFLKSNKKFWLICFWFNKFILFKIIKIKNKNKILYTELDNGKKLYIIKTN
jgi:hypothetical protein